MADLSDKTQNVNICSDDNTKLVDVIQDGSIYRLAVQTIITPDTSQKMLEVVTDQTDSIIGFQRQKGTRYTVPANYNYIIKGVTVFSSDNKSEMFVGKIQLLGTYNIGTPLFTAGTAYTAPIFGSTLFMEVTTAIGAANDEIITISYTNQDGTSGRTATTKESKKLLKNSAVGLIIAFDLQAGDYGVRSVQSVTKDKTNTGVIAIYGMIQFVDYCNATANSTHDINTQEWIVLTGETLAMDVGQSKVGVAASAERQINVVGGLVAI